MRKTRIALLTVATILVFLLTGLSVQAKGYHKNPSVRLLGRTSLTGELFPANMVQSCRGKIRER